MSYLFTSIFKTVILHFNSSTIDRDHLNKKVNSGPSNLVLHTNLLGQSSILYCSAPPRVHVACLIHLIAFSSNTAKIALCYIIKFVYNTCYLSCHRCSSPWLMKHAAHRCLLKINTYQNQTVQIPPN